MSPKPAYEQGRNRVLKIATLSRILAFFLIFFFRSIASPYDTSASINPPCLPKNHTTINSQTKQGIITRAIENSIVWDSVYYLRIAYCGYEHEQTFAFLPLLPLLMKVMSNTVLAPLVPALGYRAVLGISGYVISNAAFMVASLYLYKITHLAFGDSDRTLEGIWNLSIPTWSAILFCFNPASVFYSSVYSESIFAMFSFTGIYYLLMDDDWKAAIMFAIASGARSNGVLNAGFFLFKAMHHAYDAVKWGAIWVSIKILILGLLKSGLVFVPFVGFQVYGFLSFCKGGGGSTRPWCNSRVPYLYGFVQSHYWGVGFLKYFQFKQLPNFILAAPVLFLVISVIIAYCKENSKIFFSLGFLASLEQKEAAMVFYVSSVGRRHETSTDTSDCSMLNMNSLTSAKDHVTLRLRKKPGRVQQEISSADDCGMLTTTDKNECSLQNINSLTISKHHGSVNQRKNSGNLNGMATQEMSSADGCWMFQSAIWVPFLLQLSFMIGVAMFVMHVQVSIRFLSVNPATYWYVAKLMVSPKHVRFCRIVWVVYFCYFFVGSLLFSNFYPFT